MDHRQAEVKTKEVLKVIKYRSWGYELRQEKHWTPDGQPVQLTSAYVIDTDNYIGNKELANYLCRERHIVPEIASADHTICSIGFCGVDQKWYGWSHRAIYGFGIGDRLFDAHWRGGYTDEEIEHVPFNQRGEVEITDFAKARQAAINFAREVS